MNVVRGVEFDVERMKIVYRYFEKGEVRVDCDEVRRLVGCVEYNQHKKELIEFLFPKVTDKVEVGLFVDE